MSEPEDYVTCRICGARLTQLNFVHLRSARCKAKQKELTTSIDTLKEYKNQFPNTPTTSNKYRALRSEILMGNKNPMFGRHHSEETKTKIGNGNRGKIISMETRMKNSRTHTGMKRPKGTGEKISKANKGRKLTKKQKENVRIAKIKYINSLSDSERIELFSKTIFKGRLHPNTSEKKLIPILEPLGFRYVGNGTIVIGGHTPDFVHHTHSLIIEFDGWLGHNLASPYTTEDQPEKDDQRDADYRASGKVILRVFPEDLKEGVLFIQNKVTEWMNQLGYTHCEPFNVGDWFK